MSQQQSIYKYSYNYDKRKTSGARARSLTRMSVRAYAWRTSLIVLTRQVDESRVAVVLCKESTVEFKSFVAKSRTARESTRCARTHTLLLLHHCLLFQRDFTRERFHFSFLSYNELLFLPPFFSRFFPRSAG